VDVNLTVLLRFVLRNFTRCAGRTNDFRLQDFSNAESTSSSVSLSTCLLGVLLLYRGEYAAQNFSRICELLARLDDPLEFTLLLLLLFTAIEFSLGGSSPYTNNK